MSLLVKKAMLRFLDAAWMRSFVQSVANWENPRFVVRFVIHRFAKMYNIAHEEASRPLSSYENLMSFFTRELKEGARVVDAKAKFVSACDARIMSKGVISQGRMYQVKDSVYSLKDFVGEKNMAVYEGGEFVTLYLSPQDYHRVHHGHDAKVETVRYLPGILLPVNDFSLKHFQGVFARNKRVVFDYADGVKMVMVGALNVGAMRVTMLDGQSFGGNSPYSEFSVNANVKKGDEAGMFCFGSTVIMLYPKGVHNVKAEEGQRVQMGQPL